MTSGDGIMFVFGTRPEIIKVMPVVEALQARGFTPTCVLTGQHQELVQGTPLALARVIVPLGVKSDGNVTRWLQRAHRALVPVLVEHAPKLVVVQGDTMSAYVGARVAFGRGIPVAHIEAGVRSGDASEPWPEEGMRQEIDMLATWRYAATDHARENLLNEGCEPSTVIVTGNTVVTALAHYTRARRAFPPAKRVVVTLHRRELTRDLPRFKPVVEALVGAIRAYPDVGFVWPVHPAVAGVVFSQKPANLEFLPAMAYAKFAEMVARAQGILTDSGGLVEEATTLGVPVAVLRRVTDRPEAEAIGTARRFPPTPDGARAAVSALVEPWAVGPSAIYGTERAADHVAEHLAGVVATPVALVPTRM